MVIKARENLLGAWVFLIGVVFSILVGLSATTLLPLKLLTGYGTEIYGILVLLGLIVGFVSVRSQDSQTFLIAGAVLVIVSKFGMESVKESFIGIGAVSMVTTIFGALLAMFIPAIIVVVLKTVFSISNI